jgi:hypothetical protein
VTEGFLKEMIVAIINIHKKTMSIRARRGFLIQKNNQDQLKFKISCRAKSKSGVFYLQKRRTTTKPGNSPSARIRLSRQ